MKTFAFLFVSFLGLAASAQPADDGSVCGRFVTCGRFERLDTRDPQNPIVRGFEAFADGPSQITIQVTSSVDPNYSEKQIWKFADSGDFKIFVHGEIRAVGSCQAMTCLAAGVLIRDSVPFTQSLLLHFSPNQIDLNKVHVKADASTSSTGQVSFILKK